MEEILENLYRIEVPLPRSPLKTLNSYVLKGSDRNLVVDTGWNEKECLVAMLAGLKELGINRNRTDFFITHLHADHLGLAWALASDDSEIYFNGPDAKRFRSGFHWDDLFAFARLNGYPEDELEEAGRSHPGFKFSSRESLTFHVVKDGETIRVGDYRFNCMATPGHTWGHMCLYDPWKKVFVAGDLILGDITPNIQLWSDDWNPLKEYLTSLERVSRLDIELVLPGHRGILRNWKERIEQLKHHHQERLNEIMSILEGGAKNAFQVASQMSWDIVYDSWDLFPVSQKWFATGEAIAHLKYLEKAKRVRREPGEQEIRFSLEPAP